MNEPRVRFGSSSFSSRDWVGPFYPPGTKPGEFLRVYAGRFDTVEIDATYYAVPALRVVEGWAAKTPPEFLIAAKFPREIVHAGEGRHPDPARVLDPDHTYPVRDEFLEVMRALGPRLGPLVLQFPFFNSRAFPESNVFFDRLDRFLGDLPGDLRFAVEIRNPDWVTPAFADLCRKHRAALVLVDQAWMPHADELAERFDPVTADFCYIRLLGDREEIEKITTTWGKEVIDRSARLDRWAAFLVRVLDRKIPSVVYVNNHYAGHAPETLRKLIRAYNQAAESPF